MMTKSRPELEEILVFDPSTDAPLANRVNWLKAAPIEDFMTLLRCRRRKFHYLDREMQLPEAGESHYLELLVNNKCDPRRMIINEGTFDMFVSPDHYKTIYYAGRPGFANEGK
jgi:hypothetical protein